MSTYDSIISSLKHSPRIQALLMALGDEVTDADAYLRTALKDALEAQAEAEIKAFYKELQDTASALESLVATIRQAQTAREIKAQLSRCESALDSLQSAARRPATRPRLTPTLSDLQFRRSSRQ